MIFGFFGLSPVAYAFPNCSTAIPTTINATTALRAHVAGKEDVYKVSVPSDGLLSAFVQSNSGEYIEFYNSDCTRIAGFSFKSLSQFVVKGTYYVNITGSVSESYRVKIDGDFATDDRGVSCPSATVVRSATETGVMGPYGDKDFFQVDLKAPGHLKVEMSANQPTYLKVYDKNCIAVSNFSYRILDQNFSTPGIYYLAVEETADYSKGIYNLKFDATSNIVIPTGTCAGKQANRSGTNGDDFIRGTIGNDVIQAFGGNDVIFGLTGDDIICGGSGDDVIQGADGIDRLLGEAGNDVLQGGDKNDALDGGLGSDICDGGAQIDTAIGCEVKSLIP